jgi:hypothetical protein
MVQVGLLTAHASRADIVVTGNSIYDTISGVTWQEQLIPTSTFIATGGWVVARESQFEQLIRDAGAFTPGPQAAWVSALYSLTGNYKGPFVHNPLYNSENCTNQAAGGSCFNSTSYGYQEVDGSPGLYAFVSPPPPAQNFGPHDSAESPDQHAWNEPYVAALVVDHPVPLPGALWLMLSALPALLRVGIRKTRVGSVPAR